MNALFLGEWFLLVKKKKKEMLCKRGIVVKKYKSFRILYSPWLIADLELLQNITICRYTDEMKEAAGGTTALLPPDLWINSLTPLCDSFSLTHNDLLPARAAKNCVLTYIWIHGCFNNAMTGTFVVLTQKRNDFSLCLRLTHSTLTPWDPTWANVFER